MILYADCNSGRPLCPEVAEKISSLLGQDIANPSQILSPLGKRAKELVELARVEVAQLVDSSPEEVVFTSGATESCFHAILGAFLAKKSGNKILSSALEHPAVSEACKTISEIAGLSQETIKANRDGEIFVDDFIKKIDHETFLVSLMAANNETGVCFDWTKLADHCAKQETVSHSDVTQWIGRLPFSFKNSKVDLASFSSHKLGGPQGVGALLVKKEASWISPMPGGGQEQARRGGTEPVLAIVGFGLAAKIRKNSLNSSAGVRDSFEKSLCDQGILVVGKNTKRLPNTSMLIVNGVGANELVQALAEKEIIISSGSACSQGSGSKVLQAMGYSETESRSAVRISFSEQTTHSQAAQLANTLVEQAQRIREKNILELRDVYEE